MPGIAEYLLATRGCLKLLRFDASALGFFDRSAAGALRSFGVALPVYLYYLVQVLNASRAIENLDTARYVAAMSLAYVFLWISFPLALLGIAEFFTWRDRAIGAISVYNWSTLLTVALHLPSLFMDMFGWAAGFATLLDYLALGYMLALNGFIFSRTLGVSILAAALLVAGDLILSQLFILPAFAYLGRMAL